MTETHIRFLEGANAPLTGKKLVRLLLVRPVNDEYNKANTYKSRARLSIQSFSMDLTLGAKKNGGFLKQILSTSIQEKLIKIGDG